MLARLMALTLVAQGALAAAIAWLLAPAVGLPLAILVGVGVPLMLHALLMAAHFLMSSLARSPCPPGFAQTPMQAVGTYLRELRTSIATFDWRVPFLGSVPLPSAPAPGQARRPPVLFVHGMLCNRAVWRPFARHLSALGHVTGSVNLEPAFGSIDDYAPIIAAGIEALCERTGEEQVALVCHSMGGLAARAYLRRYGADAVERVVTIATPHRGTANARFATRRNMAQMRRDSDWLTALAASETSEIRRLFTVIFTHHDNVVSPQSIQTLPDAHVIEFGRVGHLAILRRPAVWEATAERLYH